MSSYKTHTLSNGLRLVHLPNNSSVSYCGVIINVGSRDENDDEYGMAHFTEHMLFKGTKKRNSRQIINRLEDVGGELNAYTSKEETVVYAGFLNEYSERAIELIADIVQNSQFLQFEIEKEIEIIQDEIQSYNDSPSELIFDDFEEMLFFSNPMAHNVLGKKETITGFDTVRATEFYNTHYTPDEMVFFSLGSVDFNKIIRWCKKYFITTPNKTNVQLRQIPEIQPAKTLEFKKNTHQVHCMIGTRAYDIHHPDRLVLYLLNNILGGPGMNSLLNLSLREKHGLVYNVEAEYQAFTDTGWWAVYFGCDPENTAKCEKLIRKELAGLCNSSIAVQKLKRYKLQLMGQMAISSENKENLALSLGKSYLRFGRFDELEDVRTKINAITPEQLQRIACEIFNPDNLTILKYN